MGAQSLGRCGGWGCVSQAARHVLYLSGGGEFCYIFQEEVSFDKAGIFLIVGIYCLLEFG